MAIWYEVERNDDSINDFLDSNWGFHDFRHEQISYIPGKDMVEIFLQYDTRTEGVLLRFSGIYDMRVNTKRDYDADWLSGSVLLLFDNRMIWLDDDSWDEKSIDHLEELKSYTTWVECERIFWVVTDEKGVPVEMPEDRIHQVWTVYGETVIKDFKLKEFTDDWKDVLRPPYLK